MRAFLLKENHLTAQGQEDAYVHGIADIPVEAVHHQLLGRDDGQQHRGR